LELTISNAFITEGPQAFTGLQFRRIRRQEEQVNALLKKDEEVLRHLAPGVEPPAPLLYDPELHRQHHTGHYQPLKRRAAGNRIVQVSS
jgi:hypothetical protein